MKMRWFAVPFAIAIVVMMVVASLPSPISPSEPALAVNWGGTTKTGFSISQIHFAESIGGGNDYSHDIYGNDIIFTSSSSKIFAINESFSPTVIYILIQTPDDPTNYVNYVGISVEIKDPNGNVVHAKQQMGGLPTLLAGYLAFQSLLYPAVDWSIAGQYTITVKLYYWM